MVSVELRLVLFLKVGFFNVKFKEAGYRDCLSLDHGTHTNSTHVAEVEL